MQFNSYFWQLYNESPNGKENIQLFEQRNHQAIAKKFNTGTYLNDLSREGVEYYKNSELKNLLIGKQEIDFTLALNGLFSKYDFNQPAKTFRKIVDDGAYLPITDQHVNPQDYDLWFNNLEIFSTSLFLSVGDFFVPYYFRLKFNILENIFSYFEIPLPKIPIKKDWRGRLFYYLDICEALYEFRMLNNLSHAELCAFIYDFAPEAIRQKESNEMPKPSKTWFCGGNKLDFEYLDEATPESISHWQGNVDTRKGDIIVMYCLAPRSFIHSIWRADCDGFIDPFFYYYSLIYITNAIRVTPIKLKELTTNPTLSQNPLIRSNMQGNTGYPVSYADYNAILKMLEDMKMDVSTLPRIEPDHFIENVELENERDVEVHLVEPLLEKLGWDASDWIRQMPVKMGTGERNYPDYCFLANRTRGDESAVMIIETKFSIRSSKDLQEAYYQAKSYALRLQSRIFSVAAKEGLWIFRKNRNQFDLSDFIHFTWKNMEHPDYFYQTLNLMGKKIIKQR